MDPQRIEWVDMYSNVLLVTQQKVKLAKIAHEFVALAKDRPEVCVAIGNSGPVVPPNYRFSTRVQVTTSRCGLST